MLPEGKFGVEEAVAMATITISTKLFFTSPGYLTRFVGTAGWYMTILSCAVATLAFTFVLMLLKRFPGKDIIQIFDIVLGRPVGFVFSLAFCAAFLGISAIIVREFADVVRVFVLPVTQLGILIGACAAAAAYAAYTGLETIARISRFAGFLMFFAYALVILLSVKNFKLTNIFPILGYGIDQTLLHGVKRCSSYQEIMVLTVIAGSLQGFEHLRKAAYRSMVLSGLIISSGLLCFSLVFPYYTNQELIAPVYNLTRIIRFGEFLQRLDPIFLFLWIMATFVTVSVLFYSLASVYCKMFRLQDPKPLIVPLAVLLFCLASLPRDILSVTEESVQISREYGWIVFFVLPLITLLVAVIRKKEEGGKNANGKDEA